MPRYSQVTEFYTALLEGHTVKVQVQDSREFETIRTTLHRYHRSVVDIGGSEHSLLANLNGQEASFRLGPRKRPPKQYSFEVIEDHGA